MYTDPVEIYQEYLNSKSIKNKSARNNLARVKKRQYENNTKVPENKNNIRYNQLTKTDNDKIQSIENMFIALNK